ncbi:MAG: tyrosinase family protein [Proteobacteria bacterium]|nr:tyrosinase family protein [Pseudomonadota bacterium]
MTGNNLDTLRIRKEIFSLDAQELQQLRIAFEEIKGTEGEAGYQHIAGLYGLPSPAFSPNYSPLFLPWMRAYLVKFERALRRVNAGVVLPYWDWTSDEARANGIPMIFAGETYEDVDEGVWLNPLFRGPIEFKNGYTQRAPKSPAALRRLSDSVHYAMRATNFASFSSRLETSSDGLHCWIGGAMADSACAAYDPIFWAHYANIDRLWAQWQRESPDAEIPESVKRTVLVPLEITGAEAIDTRQLGYDYDDQRFDLTPVLTPDSQGLASFGPWNVEPPPATLWLKGLRLARQSYEIRAFINLPEANAETDIEDNPHFAGSIYIMGMGNAVGTSPPAAHNRTSDRSLDVSGPVHGLLSPGQELTVRLVALDTSGKEISFDSIALRGVSISS